MNIKFICIDFQKEFSDEKGKWFNRGKSVSFIKNDLVAFFRENNLKINEIISDYRQPRPGDRGNGCIPGTFGYESDIPKDIKNPNQWIKCMNNPIWVRENIGKQNLTAGLPYQDSKLFDQWLLDNIGTPEEVDLIILFGLTMDCCVLCTAQELNYRGYKVKMLYEATDPMKNDEEYKKLLVSNSPLLVWSGIIYFEDLKRLLGNHEMKLDEKPFEMINSGEKEIEYRLCDEKRKILKVGDTITFTKRLGQNESIEVIITELKKYKTLLDMYSASFNNYLKNYYNTPDDVVKDTTYYTQDEIDKYGCLAIHFKKIGGSK